MITEENKNLLFRDLSSRFSYGVKVAYTTLPDDMPKVWDVIGLPAIGLVDIVVPGKYRFAAVPVEEIKPYLRPISSMTAEEEYEYHQCKNIDFLEICEMEHTEMLKTTALCFSRAIDWLNENKFDYCGLISMGLALEAPEGIYKTE